MKRKTFWHGLMTACTAALCATLLSACTGHSEKSQPTAGAEPTPTGAMTMITIKTTLGEMQAELYADKAPETVKNFLQYVKDGHYNGTIFHRVIANFMIQGGGFTRDMAQKSTRAPVRNEAANGLKNRSLSPHDFFSSIRISALASSGLAAFVQNSILLAYLGPSASTILGMSSRGAIYRPNFPASTIVL